MKKTFIIFSSIISLLAGITAILQYTNETTLIDISGQWLLEDKIERGPYKGSVVVFNAYLVQKGTTFSGEAEKIFYNGQKIAKEEKSRIELVSGSIVKNQVRVNFIEHGKVRQTRGQFLWKIINNNKLEGTFSSTTNSKGKSILSRK